MLPALLGKCLGHVLTVQLFTAGNSPRRVCRSPLPMQQAMSGQGSLKLPQRFSMGPCLQMFSILHVFPQENSVCCLNSVKTVVPSHLHHQCDRAYHLPDRRARFSDIQSTMNFYWKEQIEGTIMVLAYMHKQSLNLPQNGKASFSDFFQLYR